MQLTQFLSVTLMGGCVVLAGETNAVKPRAVSLDDCVQMALEHNLEVQITRLDPLLARNTLRGSYAAYEPSFDASLQHDYSSSPGGIDAQGRQYPSTQQEIDSFSLGLSGLVPWGLRYNLGTSSRNIYGFRPGSRLDFTTLSFTTNTVWVTDPFTGNLTFVTSSPGVTTVLDPFENASATAGIQLTQPLLKNFWIDAPRMTITINKKRLKSSEYVLQQQIMRTVTDVQVAYYALIAARETIKVQQDALQLAERLLIEDKKRVEVGVLAPLEEKQDESEVAARQADLLAAQSALSVRQNDLKNLLTDNYGEWMDAQLEPSEQLRAPQQIFDRHDSWNKGLTLRPDLQQVRIELEIQNVRLRYDRNQLYPQLDLRGSYGHTGSSREFSGALDGVRTGDSPVYSYGVVLSLPLSNRQARYAYRNSKLNVEQALLRLKQLEQTAMVQIDDAMAQARSSYERIDATQKAVQFAQAALEAEQKKLDNGKSTSFEVLVLQQRLTARRSEVIRALTDYNLALAQLAFYEGTTLERNHIKVESR